MPGPPPGRVGLWLVGAQGSIAAAVVLGARALAAELVPPCGLVTALPELAALPLAGVEALVFGGWDLAPGGLLAQARALAHEDRAVSEGLVERLAPELAAVEQAVRPGYADGGGPASRAVPGFVPAGEALGRVVERLGDDLDRFRAAHGLATVVVVNLASTEPPLAPAPAHQRLADFQQALERDERAVMAPSALYAYAALERGCPYVNFTPSAGVALPALQELGLKHHLPFYGRDGKTGETLVKTALAPLFRWRNLEVLSWEGFNILGGGDGRVLADPRHKQSKVESKEGALAAALGYSPHAGVSIEYVPSLGHWKTAWDFVHFRGFLGAKMSLQFIWQGCDALLAAPLVLDLVRLTELAQRQGEAGPMTHLACFFKEPMGVPALPLPAQVALLLDYAGRRAGGPAPS